MNSVFDETNDAVYKGQPTIKKESINLKQKSFKQTLVKNKIIKQTFAINFLKVSVRDRFKALAKKRGMSHTELFEYLVNKEATND